MRRVLVLLAVLGALLAPACAHTSGAEAKAANVVATVADTFVYKALGDAYSKAGEAAVNASASREDAEKELDVVRAEWKPVWDAWDALAAADRIYVACAGQSQCHDARTVQDVIDAWCNLRAAATAVLVQLPDPAGVCLP